MPIGAIGVMSIQKTLNSGMLRGFLIGSAAALVDLFYASVAVLGLGMIKNFLFNHEKTLGIIGGIILLFSGYKIYKSDTIKQFRDRTKLTKMSMANDFLSSLLIALSNPLTIIGFGTFLATFQIHEALTNLYNTILFLFFIFSGALFWWFILSFTINKFRKRIRLKLLIIINRVTGLTIIAMGLAIFIYLFIKK